MSLLSTKLVELSFVPKGIVHVGAHYAQEIDDYLGFSPRKIVWIEADPLRFERLRRVTEERKHLPTQQVVIQALVTDKDGEPTQFHRFSNDGASSSIFHQTPLLQSTWPGLRETGETVTLESSRLDTVLAANGVRPEDIDALVFDVQGAEILALSGAGSFLETARFIEVEVSQDRFYEGGALASDLDAFLTKSGFERISPLKYHGDTIYRAIGR